MARKTKAQKDQEAREAQAVLNTNRDGILIRPGQIWKDMNPRSEGRRFISVTSVEDGIATITDGKRALPLAVKRMYPHSRGYEIYGSP